MLKREGGMFYNRECLQDGGMRLLLQVPKKKKKRVVASS
jgi:hypothetical protein